MSYKQRIYENFDENKKLEEVYDTETDFYNALVTSVTNLNMDYLFGSDTANKTKVKALMSLLAYPIYDEYYDDKLAYEDTSVFIRRLTNSLEHFISKWYMQRNIEMDILKNASLDMFIVAGGTHSETSENAQTGSSVIQKSASTPTGISHNASVESIVMDLSYDEQTDNTTMNVDDNYDDKYTNFVGKTSGVHRNEVGRETDITRKSSYELAMDILNKIPYSFINQVLAEVSEHFIYVY